MTYCEHIEGQVASLDLLEADDCRFSPRDQDLRVVKSTSSPCPPGVEGTNTEIHLNECGWTSGWGPKMFGL